MDERPAAGRRIEHSAAGDGLDIAALEDFCRSARANGAAGSTVVGARVSVRGRLRRLWVEVGVEPGGGESATPGGGVSLFSGGPHTEP